MNTDKIYEERLASEYAPKDTEADHLIIRTEYPQIPPKVEYSLSERGKSLMVVLDQLCA